VKKSFYSVLTFPILGLIAACTLASDEQKESLHLTTREYAMQFVETGVPLKVNSPGVRASLDSLLHPLDSVRAFYRGVVLVTLEKGTPDALDFVGQALRSFMQSRTEEGIKWYQELEEENKRRVSETLARVYYPLALEYRSQLDSDFRGLIDGCPSCVEVIPVINEIRAAVIVHLREYNQE